ncbi:hypothetical protein G6K88_07700 [Agrobacterium rhizogenes]|uniref:hypothetical protein n=1 Tax=Rhizobium rhizogenes TaxID=359 RepID=UPI0015748377|nr:hypothetical protein [Rhizobium rhizogenes]NTF80842.1 hypothetical protein [Rhizobium rhizogenes]NTI01901.1 hypothetical protein [Rhizobium rhizogenes]NTI08704.1 hypothetical protein [Rhizobium rhizogenes]
MRRIKLVVTTAADGTATAFMTRTSGKICSIHYIKDAQTAFADGVDFTVTAEETGETIWNEANVNASAARYPRIPVQTPQGAAVLYAAGGAPVTDKIAISNDRLKFVIAQGGNAKSGTFYAVVE